MSDDALHDLFGRKWTTGLLLALREAPQGFSDLERHLGITSKPLAERLDALRCRGIVDRTVHPTTPPTTTYRLTDRGATVADRLAALADTVERVDCSDCEGIEWCTVPVAAPGEDPARSAGATGDCCAD